MTQTQRSAVLAAIALAFALAFVFWPSTAQANVGCNGTGSIAFGTSQTATGTINYTCNNYGGSAVTLTICSTRGTVSYPGTEAQPVMTSGGSSQLNFNLYTTSARTQVWNSTTPISTSVTIPAGGAASGTISFYGYIPSGQSPPPPPGSYQTWFHNTVIGFLAGGTCQANYSNWSGVQISLTATATASNQITVTCPNGTAYYVGLAPSNGNTAGAGVMSGTGGNAAKVPYQLRSGSSGGPIWGNTATSTSVGNGVSGTGNGSPRSISVYATLPSANYTADS